MKEKDIHIPLGNTEEDKDVVVAEKVVAKTEVKNVAKGKKSKEEE
jgi:hypothetical protein